MDRNSTNSFSTDSSSGTANLSEAYGPELDELVQYGLIEWDGERLRLSRRGILLANEVAVRFLEPRGTLE